MIRHDRLNEQGLLPFLDQLRLADSAASNHLHDARSRVGPSLIENRQFGLATSEIIARPRLSLYHRIVAGRRLKRVGTRRTQISRRRTVWFCSFRVNRVFRVPTSAVTHDHKPASRYPRLQALDLTAIMPWSIAWTPGRLT